jgi:citrate synthase
VPDMQGSLYPTGYQFDPRRLMPATLTRGGEPEMFTVLFALGQPPGRIAQWRERMADPATKIGRPRQVYVGPTRRAYMPVGDR